MHTRPCIHTHMHTHHSICTHIPWHYLDLSEPTESLTVISCTCSTLAITVTQWLCFPYFCTLFSIRRMFAPMYTQDTHKHTHTHHTHTFMHITHTHSYTSHTHTHNTLNTPTLTFIYITPTPTHTHTLHTHTHTHTPTPTHPHTPKSNYHFILQYAISHTTPTGRAWGSTREYWYQKHTTVCGGRTHFKCMHSIDWAKVDLVNCHPNYHKHSWRVQTDRMSHPLPLGGPLLRSSVCLYSTSIHNFYSWLHTAFTLQLYNHKITLLVMWVPSGGICHRSHVLPCIPNIAVMW